MEKSCDFIALGLYFGMWLERGRNVPNSHGPIFWNVAAMVAGTFQIHTILECGWNVTGMFQTHTYFGIGQELSKTIYGMWLERGRNVPQNNTGPNQNFRQLAFTESNLHCKFHNT